MTDISSKVLRLVFGTATAGKNHTMEFSNPKTTVTQAKVQSLIQMIITKNIIDTKNCDLTSIVDDGVAERTFTDLVP